MYKGSLDYSFYYLFMVGHSSIIVLSITRELKRIQDFIGNGLISNDAHVTSFVLRFKD